MTDTRTASSSADSATAARDGGAPDPASRQARFAEELDAIGHRTSGGDRRVVVVSAAAMVAGVVLAVVAYISSTGQADTRDVISSGILAMVGLTLVVAGGAVFVRASMTQFLRFWMLRLLYEQQRGTEGD